jgi:hypothetical protein
LFQPRPVFRPVANSRISWCFEECLEVISQTPCGNDLTFDLDGILVCSE